MSAGPRARGPAAAFALLAALAGGAAAAGGPPGGRAIDRAIDRGVAFLLRRQERNGAWGSPRGLIVRIYVPPPGGHHAFRAGTTGICLAALLEVGGDRPDVAAAIDRAEAWVLANLPHLRRATPETLYNVWGHAYGIQALVRMLRRRPGNAARCARIRDLIRDQIDRLARYECLGGGWTYYNFDPQTQRPSEFSTSFVTAAALVALREAQDAGIEVPAGLVRRGIASIQRQRKPDFSYFYDPSDWRTPMRLINRPAGSLGRSQACNIALRRWGDRAVTDAVLATGLDRLFARNGWLSIARKRPVPHESWFSIAGYFYYFGHYYAALCIEDLPAPARPPYQDRLARTLLALQERDGSWWDFPLYDYHQQYGTGFALMALARCRRPGRLSGPPGPASGSRTAPCPGRPRSPSPRPPAAGPDPAPPR